MRIAHSLLGLACLIGTTVCSIPSAFAATIRVQVNITDRGFVPSLVHGVLNRPLEIRVTNRGSRIHEFAIPDYRIYSANLAPGESSTISFSPWMSGDFTIMSDPSGENRPEFKGTLRVTDAK